MQSERMNLKWAAAVLIAGQAFVALLPAQERNADLCRRALKLNEITGKEAIRGEERALFKDKPQAKKLLAEALHMANEKPQPFTYNATRILGTVALSLKEYPAAEKFYELHLQQAKQLKSAQGLITAYGGLIDALYSQRKYVEVEKRCEEAYQNEIITETRANLEVEKDKDADDELRVIKLFLTSVLKEQILAVAKQGDVDRSMDMIDRLFKERSGSWIALDFKAKVYLAVGKPQQAAKSYEDEIARIKADDDLKKKDKESLIDEVRYTLSGVYIESGQIDKAAEQLQTLLKKDPANPSYNNDLGYIWADHDMNLAEAEKLIRKAIDENRKQLLKDNPKLTEEQLQPNAAYLDSLAWVLYKQKKYEDAKKLLEQAVEQEDGDHIEILDHLGDVLMALGQKSEALAVWKRGIENATDTQREQKRKEEVQKKVKAIK